MWKQHRDGPVWAVIFHRRHFKTAYRSYDGRMDEAQRGGTLKYKAISSLLGAVIYTAAGLHAQPALLDRLVGRNLWTEKPAQADLAQLERLIGKYRKGTLSSLPPGTSGRQTGADRPVTSSSSGRI